MKKIYLFLAGILFLGFTHFAGAAFCIPDIDDKGGCYLPTNTACKELGTYRPCEAEKPAPKPTPIPVPEPSPAPQPTPAPVQTQTETQKQVASQEEKLGQDMRVIEEKLDTLASSGKSIEVWQKEFNAVEKKVKASGNSELIKKLDEIKLKARDARGKRLFRPLFGPIKFRDVVKSPIKKFRPWLRGGIADEGISVHGYPNLNYITGYTAATAERIEIRQEADGNVYVVNTDRANAYAIFEGFGVHKGETIELPPINPTTFIGGGTGGAKAAEAARGTYAGELRGAEPWADTKVTSIADPKTGLPSLVAQLSVKNNAADQPPSQQQNEPTSKSGESRVSALPGEKSAGVVPTGMQDVRLVIKKDGQVVKQIPLVADVQEVLQPERNMVWLLMMAMGLVVLFIVVRIALK